MRFSVLGSGSSGNSMLVETARTSVLVDAGLSAQQTAKRLLDLGKSLDAIEAVLVTHEHEDHARGLETLTAARPLTVIATGPTLGRLRPRVDRRTELVALRKDATLRFADLEVEGFPVPHDAASPVGFVLAARGCRLGYLTDFGSTTDLMRERLHGLSALVVESNHDLEMLRQGPYPARLKRRILGPYGHLSNEGLSELLRGIDLRRLEVLLLAHLSRTNNRPELALAAAALALGEGGWAIQPDTCPHDRPTPMLAAASAPPALPRQLTLRFEMEVARP